MMQKISALIPNVIRFKIAREKVRFPTEFPAELELKIANTQAELEAGFRILHDSYVDIRLMDPQDEGLRVTKYHLLPTTSTIVAKWKGEVVGIISFITDSPLRLPIDSAFDISNLRRQQFKMGEISSLAVKKEFRTQNGLISLSLVRYVFEYAKMYLKIDKALVVCHPRWTDLYAGVLGMEPIKQPSIDYKFVKGAPAKGFIWNLQSVLETFGPKSNGKKIGRSFKLFYSQRLPANFIFPKRKYYKTQDPVLTPEMLEHFFVKKTNTYSELKDQEKQIISSVYPMDFRRRLPGTHPGKWKANDRLRFNVHCQAKSGWAEQDSTMEVRNVSMHGLQIRTNRPIESIVNLTIQIAPTTTVQVKAQTIWSDGLGLRGLKIIETPPHWEKYISYLQNDFVQSENQLYRRAAS